QSAQALKPELAERLVELGAAAAIVTGGHGDPVDHLFDGHEHVEIPVERLEIAATHGAARSRPAARGGGARRCARGGRRRSARPPRARRRRRPCRRPQRERKNVNAGDSLRRLRETKPLVHQITNYVVMNETANATLALGALPVMAHAREEVEEMVGLAGALVLNIGTLSPDWVEAML